MLNEKVAALCNEQINKEFYSAYLYLDIANYYADEGLDGFANWYTIQAQEERDHAMLFLQYLQNNGEKVTLEAIAKPDKEFPNHRAALEVGYEHEQYVTALINTIYGAAFEVKDYRVLNHLPSEKTIRNMPAKLAAKIADSLGYLRSAELPEAHRTIDVPFEKQMLSWKNGAALRQLRKLIGREHYDLIRDAALFFVDYLVQNKEGEWVVSPTVSPENQYVHPVTGEKITIEKKADF